MKATSRAPASLAAMQAFAHRLDPTRRTTYANSGGWGGISTVIDLVGYNYINQSNPDEQHAKFPDHPGVGTEETTTQCTRGIYFDDPSRALLSPQTERRHRRQQREGLELLRGPALPRGPVLLDRIRPPRRGVAVRLARGRLAFRFPRRVRVPEGHRLLHQSLVDRRARAPPLSALELGGPGGPGVHRRSASAITRRSSCS